jgi:uncharacterized membrane protein YccF (DUF307 family)
MIEALPEPPSIKARKISYDIFGEQLNKVEKSKLRRLLNIIYSIVVGLVVGKFFKGRTKYHFIIGIFVALGTFKIANRILHIDEDKNDDTGSNLPH